MHNLANVSLSAFELELLNNPGWILTKNQIIQKVIQLFAALSESYQQQAAQMKFPPEVLLNPAKISKGENYKGLPYVMLDYPRCFGKADVFAVRTFFWWGHYFSITLHLKGKYKVLLETKIKEAIAGGELTGAWINTSGEEWIHELNAQHTQPVEQMMMNPQLQPQLVKLSFTIPFSEWNNAIKMLEEKFYLFSKLSKV